MSEWLLVYRQNEQFFSYIMARTSYIRWDDINDVHFVPDQYAYRSWIFMVLAHRNSSQFAQTHYPDYKPTSFCFFSLMLDAEQRSSKYQFYCLDCHSCSLNPQATTLEVKNTNHYTTDVVMTINIEQWSGLFMTLKVIRVIYDFKGDQGYSWL